MTEGASNPCAVFTSGLFGLSYMSFFGLPQSHYKVITSLLCSVSFSLYCVFPFSLKTLSKYLLFDEHPIFTTHKTLVFILFPLSHPTLAFF